LSGFARDQAVRGGEARASGCAVRPAEVILGRHTLLLPPSPDGAVDALVAAARI
jgi:hypothetical protein